MFTGIVQTLGTLTQLEATGGDLRITVAAGSLNLAAASIGDSIAVNGCCLTASEFLADAFCADVSRETLALTTLGLLRVASTVNLEPALRSGDSMGGHMVSGHVDGIGEICGRESDARSWRFRIAVPQPLARYIARKGSVTVDGVSLTVNEVAGNEFGVNIVPHTLDNTIFSQYQVGTKVNIEVDLVARYIERLLEQRD